jgi:hypothetical protein|tara:strand:- start:560 stop:847 length:288 start_codon:yes stop_codon:yes gene_type:complete
MTIKNMVEMVQQHHPNASETQIIMWLNQAMDDVTDKTSFAVNGSGTFSTVSGTKYYGFTKISTIAADDEVISIETVTYDGKHIPFIREPEHMEGF